MPTFDVVSEIDQQEVRNAVDQASREVSTRYDFKGTDSTIELTEKTIELHTESEGRLTALTQVLEEKLVKREVSLKALAYGKVEEAAKGTVRQTVTLNVGISDREGQGDRQVPQGASASRACRTRSRATSSGSPARSATTSKTSSPP